MFKLIKNAFHRKTFSHTTTRKDWEHVLDENFAQVIQPWANGLALITNTLKEGQNPEGQITPRLSIRTKKSIPTTLETSIRTLSLSGFEMIFELAKKEVQQSDIYVTKNLELPDHSLVYPIEQRSTSQATGRKALLLFKSPCLRNQLLQNLTTINRILLAKERKIGEIHLTKEPVSKEAQTPIPKKMIVKTKIEVIQTRLTYLEDLENITPDEEEEKKNLQSYLIHHLSRPFS